MSKINELSNVLNENFLLKTKDKMDIDEYKSLINKHIHFTYHDRNNKTKTNLPGYVLDIIDNKVKIYTNDIIYEDEDYKDLENNPFVELFDANDITDILVFDQYTKNFDSLLDKIVIIDDDPSNCIYNITNINGEMFSCVIVSFDSFSLDLVYKYNDIEKRIDYPLYLIKDINLCC